MLVQSIDNFTRVNSDALVVSLFEGESSHIDFVKTHVVETKDFEGQYNTTYLLPTLGEFPAPKILVLGCGKRAEFNQNKARILIAKAVKTLAALKLRRIAFDVDFGFDYGKSGTIGAYIGNYSFDKYKNKKSERVDEVYFTKVRPSEIEEGELIAQAMDFARDLSNEPAAYATPQKLADIAQGLEGVETRVYDEAQIRKMNMGAYLAVAQGSINPPKFIHMKYSVENPKKRIAIIGKGICFDSGGLDIKPPASMLTMKDDMSGAACVLSIMSVLSRIHPQVEVHGIIAACENMPGGKAYKPGDILTAKNGKTIEVDNTDAEGRLTLADALCYASELGVDEVIDIATLTGACSVAFGAVCAGILGNNDELVKNVKDAAFELGEKYWELPTYEEYANGLKSEVADMRNTGGRSGGASSAGLFLKEFVSNVKWAHIDIAGVAFLDSPLNEFGKGSTGAGVRALLNYICK